MTPDQQKQFFKTNFTLKGRIFHPNLLVPVPKDKNVEGSPLKYNVMFAFKAEDNVEALKVMSEFLMKAKETFHPNIPMQFFSNPLKKFETYMRRDGKPNADYLKGHYWVNASSGKDFPPQVVDGARQPVINAAEIYSGRNAVANIGFYSFTGQQNGLSSNINAVMLMEGGNKEGGTGAVDVSKIFGGFAVDAGLPAGLTSSTAFGNGGGFV